MGLGLLGGDMVRQLQSADGAGEKEKKLKKVQKALRQIDELKAKQARPEPQLYIPFPSPIRHLQPRPGPTAAVNLAPERASSARVAGGGHGAREDAGGEDREGSRIEGRARRAHE